MMTDIRVSGYICEPNEIEVGAAGSHGVAKLRFQFDDAWDGLSRRVTWMTKSGKIGTLLGLDDCVEVPPEALETAGRRWFSVDGTAEGKQLITARCVYRVRETVPPGGENSAPPTPDEMEQMSILLNEVKDEVVAAADRVETATLNAPKIVNGTWWVYDAARSAYVDTGVQVRGDDGVSPTVSVTTITGGKRVTITDASGEHVFDIMDGEDGNDGDDGVSPGVSITPIIGGHRITITDATGAHSFDVMNGEDGAAGAGTGDMLASVYDPQGKRTDVFQYVDNALENLDLDVTADEVTFSDGETFQQKYDSGELRGEGVPGDDGVGIQSVQQTTTSSADGGENVVTVTLTNGQKSTFKFKNGSKGSPGATPTKGTDYFTAAEIAQIVADAVAQVIASGELADANHSHSASEVGARSSSWTPSQTQVTVSAATDYTTNRVRGIALAQDNPISVPNGCLCGVYTIS